MLVLTRRTDERIVINDNIEVVVLGVSGSRTRLGIECPSEVPVRRVEETQADLETSAKQTALGSD